MPNLPFEIHVPPVHLSRHPIYQEASTAGSDAAVAAEAAGEASGDIARPVVGGLKRISRAKAAPVQRIVPGSR